MYFGFALCLLSINSPLFYFWQETFHVGIFNDAISIHILFNCFYDTFANENNHVSNVVTYSDRVNSGAETGLIHNKYSIICH